MNKCNLLFSPSFLADLHPFFAPTQRKINKFIEVSVNMMFSKATSLSPDVISPADSNVLLCVSFASGRTAEGRWNRRRSSSRTWMFAFLGIMF